MIDYEKELEKFEFSPEVEQVEDVVNQANLTDMTDIVRELIFEPQGNS